MEVERDLGEKTKTKTTLCNSGTSVEVKEKSKNKKGNDDNNDDDGDDDSTNNGKSKQKSGNNLGVVGNAIVVMTDENGNTVNIDCEGDECFASGSQLQQGAGGPCEVRNGNQDCQDGYVCSINGQNTYQQSWVAGSEIGECIHQEPEIMWWADFTIHKCVMDCVNIDGANCGGRADFEDEKYRSVEECCAERLWWIPYPDGCVGDVVEAQKVEVERFVPIAMKGGSGGNNNNKNKDDAGSGGNQDEFVENCNETGGQCYDSRNQFKCCGGKKAKCDGAGEFCL
jgi:hypothetical protein